MATSMKPADGSLTLAEIKEFAASALVRLDG